MKAKEFITEGKKSRRDIKQTIKPRNPVAHAAQSVISGSGTHKDKKKAAKQGYEKHKKQPGAEGLSEFAPAGSGGSNTPRGPRGPGRDPWGDNDGPGEDPYKHPKPTHYRHSIDFFGQFEADHFDHEDMDDTTGEFKGYWDYDGKMKQIASFKFDNPRRTGSDDPGMGWYYEPQDEGVGEATGDEKFDNMLKTITDKRAVKKQKKADTQQRSQDAFNNMFGGDADFLTRGLNIRKKDVEEGRVDFGPQIEQWKNEVKKKYPRLGNIMFADIRRAIPKDGSVVETALVKHPKTGEYFKLGAIRYTGFNPSKTSAEVYDKPQPLDPKWDRVPSNTKDSKVSEISKPTLARYVKAAGKDVEQRASSQSFKSGQAGDKYNKADVTHKDTQREKGIDRALSRLSK